MKVGWTSWVSATFSKMAPGIFPCGCEATLADRPQSAYTPAMTLKNAAFLALVGMILATILLRVDKISVHLTKEASLDDSLCL